MNSKTAFAIVISLVALSALLAGCTTPAPTATPTPGATTTPMILGPTAAPTASATPASSFNEANRGQSIQVAPGSTFVVRLEENPTTGYSWNWTLTPGLELVNTSYASNNTAGLAGAGGVRTWELRTNGSGAQTFTAVYKRPWEPFFGNETTYSLNVTPSAGASTAKTYTDANSNQTITMAKGDTVTIVLRENPTTGYSWNVSATTGLTVKDLGHVTDAHPEGMVGVGGNHTWEVTATGTGSQAFSGVYQRPWEPVFGNETAYKLNINIV